MHVRLATTTYTSMTPLITTECCRKGQLLKKNLANL